MPGGHLSATPSGQGSGKGIVSASQEADTDLMVSDCLCTEDALRSLWLTVGLQLAATRVLLFKLERESIMLLLLFALTISCCCS